MTDTNSISDHHHPLHRNTADAPRSDQNGSDEAVCEKPGKRSSLPEAAPAACLNPMDPWIRLFDKLERHQPCTIAFLGGSITQGAGAQTPSDRYASRVFSWFENRFCDTPLTMINAGVGGTNSLFAAARVQEDVLDHHPDLVIVDFAVNDHPEPIFRESYEGLIRKLQASPSHPAILALSNVEYNTGINAEEVHKPVLGYYEIPSVSMKELLYPAVAVHACSWKDLSEDGLHPNNAGHALVAWNLMMALDALQKQAAMAQSETCGLTESPLEKTHLSRAEADHSSESSLAGPALLGKAPLGVNRFEALERLDNRHVQPVICEGFEADHHEKKEYTDFFSRGWTSRTPGAEISFKLPFETLAIQYRRTISRPAPKAKVYIDQVFVSELDGNFDQDWGDALKMELVFGKEAGSNETSSFEVSTQADSEVCSEASPETSSEANSEAGSDSKRMHTVTIRIEDNPELPYESDFYLLCLAAA